MVKRTLAIDVLALAGLYTMRILAGALIVVLSTRGFLNPRAVCPHWRYWEMPQPCEFTACPAGVLGQVSCWLATPSLSVSTSV